MLQQAGYGYGVVPPRECSLSSKGAPRERAALKLSTSAGDMGLCSAEAQRARAGDVDRTWVEIGLLQGLPFTLMCLWPGKSCDCHEMSYSLYVSKSVVR